VVTKMERKTVLDDTEEIRKIDRSDMLSFCVEAPKHYGKAAELGQRFKIRYPKPDTVIVAGMGGSGIGGELLKDWCRDKAAVPIEVCNEYRLPEYANKNSLVFVVSYSGETEETLSVFLHALRKKCMIICISSGGELLNIAEKLSVPHLLAPSGMAPRATLPYLFMPMPAILQKIGLVSNVEKEFSETVKILKQVSAENSPKKPVEDNFSKTLASNILGTVPIIYGFRLYRAVAQRFKTQFNENSKNPAKWEFFSELDHNEIVGWEHAKEFSRLLSVIFIRDRDEPIEMRQRINVTKELIHRVEPRLFEVWSRGKSSMAKMASVVCTGDFTSIYLALLRGIDPTPVKTITLLKDKLKKTGTKEKVVHELRKLASK
jgi:glucose/mannose-6-phosphate isomerase